LGKLLMASLEDAAKNFGFKEAYLCTKNEVIFYERCGYKKCDPILHSATTMSPFPAVVAIEVFILFLIQIRKNLTSIKKTSPLLPVPPPPPLDFKKTLSKFLSTPNHQYMWKKLD
uniref:N-acetyltransferase domain-containing protein n=1 Tax=Angiostrongylus cantonensis TaxID=6313 RepID=A0A0K0D524_ANGCA